MRCPLRWGHCPKQKAREAKAAQAAVRAQAAVPAREQSRSAKLWSYPPPPAASPRASLKIALKDPKYDPLKEVVVKINGKKVADIKGVKTLKKGVTLKKLPASGSYKISVVATTVLNQRLTGSQTYKACTKGPGKIKLKGNKKHH